LLPFFETSDYLRDLRSFPTRRSSDLKHAVAFVRAFDAAGKPLAAICHAPWLLAESGAAKGRELTSWPSLRTDLENAGARWKDAEVVLDGHVITSRKPDDVPAFSQAVIDALDSASAAPWRRLSPAAADSCATTRSCGRRQT